MPTHARASFHLHKINGLVSLIKLISVSLHILETHLFYDGLARDAPETLALGSVAVLLVWGMLMELKNRGIIFGQGKVLLNERLARLA